MSDFENYLKSIGEVGIVDEVLYSIIHTNGLPNLKPNEIVIFENGEMGLTLSLSEEKSEILLLSKSTIKVGDKVARTDMVLSVNISDNILGSIVDPLANSLEGKIFPKGEMRKINTTPLPLSERNLIAESLETGVALVDLIIPIGKGQRELVIGDRKTGKTQFFIKTIINHAKKGDICIYASVGKKNIEIKETLDAIKKGGADKNTVVVASSAADPPGLIFITPFTAMTIAEYFRDKGKDVVIIIDDLTNHAIYYRQISLLAGRFPGRNSYPGDIFYVHSRLLERAGSFKKGSITCFPLAESILGDLSGYIQTNLMSITDGHIFFDSELAALGRHPSINAFLSVTRVGQQAQTPLLRDLSRELSSFLVSIEKLRGFVHFGAELSEEIIQKLRLGDRVLEFFNQPVDTMPINTSILVTAMLWTGNWRDQKPTEMRAKIKKLVTDYVANPNLKKQIDSLISSAGSFRDLINNIREKNYGQENYY